MKSHLLLAALPLMLAAACSETTPAGSGTTQPNTTMTAIAAPDGQKWTDMVAKTDQGYRIGNPDAAIKLVEYGARSCPTCGAFAREAFEPMIRDYVATGAVSFEFRDFLVHGAPDLALAQLGTCGPTETFFPILEQMYANQSAFLDKLQATPQEVQQKLAGAAPTVVTTTLAEQMGAIDFMKQRGLPEAQARRCLQDQKKLEAIAKPTEAASASNLVTGTPTFILNGKKLDNVVSWAQMQQALNAAGAAPAKT